MTGLPRILEQRTKRSDDDAIEDDGIMGSEGDGGQVSNELVVDGDWSKAAEDEDAGSVCASR